MINELHYIDFEPQIVSKSFWKGNDYESTAIVMERVNEWVRRNYNSKIINVETLLVPITPFAKKEKNAKKLSMQSGYVYMIEVIRVWYQ